VNNPELTFVPHFRLKHVLCVFADGSDTGLELWRYDNGDFELLMNSYQGREYIPMRRDRYDIESEEFRIDFLHALEQANEIERRRLKREMEDTDPRWIEGGNTF